MFGPQLLLRCLRALQQALIRRLRLPLIDSFRPSVLLLSLHQLESRLEVVGELSPFLRIQLLQLREHALGALDADGAVFRPPAVKLGKRERIDVIARRAVIAMRHRIGLDGDGRLVSAGQRRVVEIPFLKCCTRAGSSRRSICARLIFSSSFLKASGSGAVRRS